MTGLGHITKIPGDRARWMTISLVSWQIVVFAVAIWWGSLLIKQGKRIRELEGAVGVSPEISQTHFSRTERMLFWESSVFVILLFGSSGFLSWMYWRDTKRARSIQAFFASFTHELRTPLTSIRLQAESLAENVSDEHSKKLIGRLLEDSMRLESQVDKTLELARVEGGGPVYTQNLLVKPLVERLARHSKEVYSDKIDFEIKADDVNVEADTSSLQMIFRNLVENSIRHSKKDKVRIAIDVFSKDGKAEIQFKDNGGNVDTAENLGELFQKGRTSSGAGVGLYLVRTLMKRMGGDAQFQAANDGFQVNLEFAQTQERDHV